MTTHNVMQGSPEWLALRWNYFTASETSAMRGTSKRITRQALLHARATGNEREFSQWVQQNLLDKGHECEAIARPWAEEIIGEDLYPATVSAEIDGIPLLASLDGITMDESVNFEHKLLNAVLDAALAQGEIPEEYKDQLEQGLMVTGAQRCLFMASSGDRAGMRYSWYESEPKRAAEILAGWRQFREDLKNYQHTEVLPAAPGRQIMALPALAVRLIGEVQESNLALYRQKATEFIESINTDLKTDEDFATADLTVKFCKDAEDQLEVVKEQALSQTESIRELFATVDHIRETLRAKRLHLNQLVQTRKDAVRAEIRQEGITALAEHRAALEQRIGRSVLTYPQADFAGVMRSKKTVKSLRDAVDNEVARVKILGNAIADLMQINLQQYRVLAADHEFLFSGLDELLTKPADDFRAHVKQRIAEYQDQKAKEEEAQRERIRQEERTKAELELAAKAWAPIPSEPLQAAPTAPPVHIVTPMPAVGSPVGAAPAPLWSAGVSIMPADSFELLRQAYMIAASVKHSDAQVRRLILDLLRPVFANAA